MASKQKAAKTSGDAELQTLKVGSYMRYVGDGDRVDGRITWANGTHVKIKWNDGEQVTWKREELAAKPIKILEAAGDDGQPEQPQAVAEPTHETTVPTVAEQPPIEQAPEALAVPAEQPATLESRRPNRHQRRKLGRPTCTRSNKQRQHRPRRPCQPRPRSRGRERRPKVPAQGRRRN